MKHLLLLSILCTFSSGMAQAKNRLLIFVGAASKPPIQEIVSKFEKINNCVVDANYGGSGKMLASLILSQQGDIFLPGSSDYMEKAKREGLILSKTEKRVVYLAPAINVAASNPHNISSLKDLLNPKLRIGIANPENVCVGAYAVEIIERARSLSSMEKKLFRQKLINYTSSCATTATAIQLKTLDAVIGWRVFQYWDPQRIKSIKLAPKDVVRIAYIPVALTKFSKNRKLAEKFIKFLLSKQGKEIFKRYNYLFSKQEAYSWLGGNYPIGGTYKVPANWIVR